MTENKLDITTNTNYKHGNIKQIIINKEVPKFGKRHIEVISIFVCFLIGYCIKVNFSLTIVAMTDPNANENKDIPTFDWTNKNVIISAFFIGYILPQVPAGWLMSKYGPKWFLVSSMAVCAIAGFLIPPLAIYFGSTAVIVCRMIQGFAEGFLIPALPCFISRWIPLTERGRLGTFIYAAACLGSVVSMFLSGFIAVSPYGWPMTFHLFSALGILWCVYYTIFGYNLPSQHKSITETEKLYIQETSIDVNKKRLPTPWKHIITSLPVWALLYTFSCYTLGAWILVTQIPTYISKIMKMNIESNGTLTALMFLVQWAISISLAIASDYITNKSILSRSTTRKCVAAFGNIGPAICLIFLAQCSEEDTTKSIVLLMLSLSACGANICSTAINSVDLSVNHSGVIQGITNGFSHIFAILAPLIVQYLIDDENNHYQWKVVFYMSSAVFTSGAIVFIIFGSGKTQTWDDINREGTEEE